MQVSATGDVTPSVAMDRFENLVFNEPRLCSVAATVEKSQGVFVLDIQVSDDCYAALMYRGTAPTFQVYLPQRNGLSAGYVTIPVKHSFLDERDEILRKLDSLNVDDIFLRNDASGLALVPEYIVETRFSLHETGRIEDDKVSNDLCLKVSAEEIQKFEAEGGPDPFWTYSPRPTNCVFQITGTIQRLTVEESFAANNRELLEELVARSQAHEAVIKQNLGNDYGLATRLEDAFKEADNIARVYGKAKFARFMIRSANGGCEEWLASYAPYRDAVMDYWADKLPSNMRQAFLSAKVHKCDKNEPEWIEFESASKDLFAQMSDAFRARARRLAAVQAVMKANPHLVGVATNHILNVDETSFAIEYKDLPIFPADGMKAPELALAHFSFDNPWISLNYDVTKSHPLINNLRSAYNDGYAITYGGFPVAALVADIVESGGASVTYLPEPKPIAANGEDPFASVLEEDAKQEAQGQNSGTEGFPGEGDVTEASPAGGTSPDGC